MSDAVKSRLVSAIRECDIHRHRIVRSIGLLNGFFPVSRESIASLDEERIEHIDQFIYRFSKFQDAMGTRLFPSVFILIESDEAPRPFLDMLPRLEKYGIVSDSALWQFFRTLRNNFAHDYPESADMTVETLNTLFKRWPEFDRLYMHAKEYVENAGLLPGETSAGT